MEDSEKNIITKWKSEIVQNTNDVSKLLDLLEAKKALTSIVVNKIRSYGNQQDQVRHMLTSLQKRPYFDIFCDCLLESGNKDIADRLRPELADDPVRIGIRYSKGSHGSGFQCEEDLEARNLPEVWPDPNWSPFNVKVYPVESTRIKSIFNSSKWCYKMKSTPRGRAIIIVNSHFPTNISKKSFNHESDLVSLDTLLKSLGYEWMMWSNLTKDALMAKLLEESSNIENERMDSFIMVFLTHGTEAGIYMSDGETVSMSEILVYFSTARCPYLVDKPKMFFVQACQGRGKDTGLLVASDNGFNPIEPARSMSVGISNLLMAKRDTSATLETPDAAGEMTKLPDATDSGCDEPVGHYTDMLVSCATTPGYASWKGDHGTWYIQALVEVLSKKSAEEDLGSMLTMVHNLVSMQKTKSGFKQTAYKSFDSLRKKVYFFPGLTGINSS